MNRCSNNSGTFLSQAAPCGSGRWADGHWVDIPVCLSIDNFSLFLDRDQLSQKYARPSRHTGQDRATPHWPLLHFRNIELWSRIQSELMIIIVYFLLWHVVSHPGSWLLDSKKIRFFSEFSIRLQSISPKNVEKSDTSELHSNFKKAAIIFKTTSLIFSSRSLSYCCSKYFFAFILELNCCLEICVTKT